MVDKKLALMMAKQDQMLKLLEKSPMSPINMAGSIAEGALRTLSRPLATARDESPRRSNNGANVSCLAPNGH